jgi:hypothetical protein
MRWEDRAVRAGRGRRNAAIALAFALAAAAIAGCGGSGQGSAKPAPDRCVDGWNEDSTALSFGRHVYNTHESHRAEVALLEAEGGNPNVPAGRICAVVFAVPESDIEYGAVGLVVTDLGWASMQELARDDQATLDRIQGEASSATNATLFPDGQLDPD